MKLSAIISEYRRTMDISQREFARRCDLSNSYISFIEKEYNPKTGKPMVPTLEQYKKIATGMNMTLHSLFEMLDEDSPVNLSEPSLSFEDLSDDEKSMISAFRAADVRAREDAMSLLLQHPAAK